VGGVGATKQRDGEENVFTNIGKKNRHEEKVMWTRLRCLAVTADKLSHTARLSGGLESSLSQSTRCNYWPRDDSNRGIDSHRHTSCGKMA
jgi:hypothetical protein